MKNVRFAAFAVVAPFIASTAAFAQFDMKIIGGDRVRNGDPVAETTVLLVTQYPEGTGICSGSLIDDDIVVTAAHCVTDGDGKTLPVENMQVQFKLAATDGGPVAPVTGMANYPTWKGDASRGIDQGDIAIVRFRTDSGTLPRGYRKASLLPSSKGLTQGEPVTLAGYGVDQDTTWPFSGSGILRKVDGVKVFEPNNGRTETMLDQRERKGACKGDSGGPAFVKQNGEYLLWGVTNRAEGATSIEGLCSHFSVYTRISAYGAWIRETAATLRKNDPN